MISLWATEAIDHALSGFIGVSLGILRGEGCVESEHPFDAGGRSGHRAIGSNNLAIDRDIMSI